MSALRFAIAFGVVLSAGVARAAGDEGSEPSIWIITLNLVLLLAVLFYFGRKPVVEYFRERRDQVHRALTSADELRSEVEARHTEWQRKLVALDQELDALRDQARQRGETEREHILAEARAAAERIRRDATQAVDQELRRAQEELREEAAALAVELAGQMLQQQVGDADRSRLVDEFIDKVESGAADGRTS